MKNLHTLFAVILFIALCNAGSGAEPSSSMLGIITGPDGFRLPGARRTARMEGTETFVNDHVYFSTEQTERAIFVRGIMFAHHTTADHVAEAYAVVSLQRNLVYNNSQFLR